MVMGMAMVKVMAMVVVLVMPMVVVMAMAFLVVVVVVAMVAVAVVWLPVSRLVVVMVGCRGGGAGVIDSAAALWRWRQGVALLVPAAPLV